MMEMYGLCLRLTKHRIQKTIMERNYYGIQPNFLLPDGGNQKLLAMKEIWQVGINCFVYQVQTYLELSSSKGFSAFIVSIVCSSCIRYTYHPGHHDQEQIDVPFAGNWVLMKLRVWSVYGDVGGDLRTNSDMMTQQESSHWQTPHQTLAILTLCFGVPSLQNCEE